MSRSLLFSLSLLLVISLSALCHASTSFIIPNMPYHRQQTNYACGDASFEMVMHHFGSDINQLAIIDVMRTSNESGTQSYDLVRGGHFSAISSTPEQYLVLFPEYAPKNGWNSRGRKMGYASFGHRQTEQDGGCYVEDLIPILDAGIPVIVLMAYAEGRGGHYRVTTGYEINNGNLMMHLLDPWDRDGNARIQKYTREHYCKLWNYREPVKSVYQAKNRRNSDTLTQPRENVDRFDPYFAAIIYPWPVSVEFNFDESAVISTDPGSNIIVTARISYPCYKPFCNSETIIKLVAEDASAIIYYPDYFRLVNGDTSQVKLGNLSPGDTRTVQWHFYVQDTKDNMKLDDIIRVVASGKVHGSVPEMWYNSKISSPAYNYTDIIGGEGVVHY